MKKALLTLSLFTLCTFAQSAPLSDDDKAEALAQFTTFQTALKNKNIDTLYNMIDARVYRRDYLIMDSDLNAEKARTARQITLQIVSRYKKQVFENLKDLLAFKVNTSKKSITPGQWEDKYCAIETKGSFVSQGGKTFMEGQRSTIDGLQVAYSTSPKKTAKEDEEDGCEHYGVYSFEFKDHQLKLVNRGVFP